MSNDKTNYVFSTLTAGTTYVQYEKRSNGGPPEAHSPIAIKGGTNLANKQLMTPQGVMTAVTDEELALLKKNPIFLQHQKDGFIKVDTSKTKISRAVRDMQPKDLSAPKTPEDYVGSKIKPMTTADKREAQE